MSNKIIVVADDGTCSKKQLRPYPIVTSPTGSLQVVPVTDADGRVTYQIEDLIDVNLDDASLDPSTLILTLTDNDGSEETVDLSKLRSLLTNTITGNRIGTHDNGSVIVDINETITSLTANASGLTYVNEAGVSVTITACTLLGGIADSTDFIGG